MVIVMKVVMLLVVKNVQVHQLRHVQTVWMIIGQILSMVNVIASGHLWKDPIQKEFATTATL